MNLKGIALATIIGLATPAVIDITTNQTVVAGSQFPEGDFADDGFLITLWYANSAHHYRGEDKKTGNSIELSGAKVSGTSQRRIYTWNNTGYRYQITWQPSQPDVVRLQVFTPKGKQVLNRLLVRQYGVGG